MIPINNGYNFRIRSNLSGKNGAESGLLNHLLEILWVRPKGKEDAYEETSEIFVEFTPMGSKRPTFVKSIFQRTRNGKRTCVSYVKDKGGYDRYVADKLIHKFSKKEDASKPKEEPPIGYPPPIPLADKKDEGKDYKVAQWQKKYRDMLNEVNKSNIPLPPRPYTQHD